MKWINVDFKDDLPDTTSFLLQGILGAGVGIVLLVLKTLFSGPAQVALANLPYTIYPVIDLYWQIAKITAGNERKVKIAELKETMITNVYTSLAYFLCQLTVLIFCLHIKSRHNNSNRVIKWSVYAGSGSGLTVFILFVVLFAYLAENHMSL